MNPVAPACHEVDGQYLVLTGRTRPEVWGDRSPDACPLAGEVLHLDPGSDGLHVVPPAPRPRPAAGHVAVEKVHHDPHGREPEHPRPEPPRPAEPPRDGQEYRPFGDPHGYRLGPPGEHHAQFPAYLLPQGGPSIGPLSDAVAIGDARVVDLGHEH